MLVDKVKQYMAVSHRSCIIAVALLVVSCGEQAVKTKRPMLLVNSTAHQMRWALCPAVVSRR